MGNVADRPNRASLYTQVAAELRGQILGGQQAAGSPLPSEDRLAARHGVSRDTIRAALSMLRSEGLVTTVQGGATYVRDRRTIRLPVSRYSRTFNSGTPAPFQAAAAESGLTGSVKVVSVETLPADEGTARLLEIHKKDRVVVRVRHNMLGDREPETVQVSTSVIPMALVAGSPLAGADRIASGVYAAFDELGHTPTTLTEEVTSRAPTPEEAETLELAQGMSVLEVQRVTRDQDGRPIELVRVVATADRTVLVYDDLPITRAD